MATNSQIAIYENSVLKFVSCHYDGYILGVGLCLHKHYQDVERVRGLVNLGNLSILAPSTECPENHSFENQIKGYTVAYHRDRQEDYQINIVTDIKKEQIYLMMKGAQFKYIYMADECKWYVLQNKKLVPLYEALKELETFLLEQLHKKRKELLQIMRGSVDSVKFNLSRKVHIDELQEEVKCFKHGVDRLSNL